MWVGGVHYTSDCFSLEDYWASNRDPGALNLLEGGMFFLIGLDPTYG